MAAKEVEYENIKKEHEALVIANQKFYNYATKFRELYLTVDNLNSQKERFQAELEDAKENLQEIEGVLCCKFQQCTALSKSDLHRN